MKNVRLWLLSPFSIIGYVAASIYVVTKTAFDNGVKDTHKWIDELENER